jgi:23S rRNA (guanosine2251-2'-O)-methyltransferase
MKKPARKPAARPGAKPSRPASRPSKPGEKKSFSRGPKKEFKKDDRRPARRPDERKTERIARTPKLTSDAIGGRNPVVEALRAKVPAKELLIAFRVEMDDRINEAIRLAKNSNLPIKEVSRSGLDGITGGNTHQGIALVVKSFNYTELSQIIKKATTPGLVVAMDGVTDPHNLGAIVRSAAAFGAHGVVIPERRNASMTGSAWKASAGAAARMPIAQVTNLVRSIEDMKKAGYFVVGLDAQGNETLPKFSLANENIYVIVGSEGDGLSRLVREKCDLILSIPMSSDVESLNASVATAIVLNWVATQRA